MRLATTTAGDGPRRALLLHGLSSNAAGWWRLVPDLVDAGYTVVAPDLRGHGDSAKTPTYRFDEYAGDVLELGLGWDLVVGHSLGGTVAVLCAADSGWAARMVLEDPAIVIPDATEAHEWLLAPFEGPMTVATIAAGEPRWEHRDHETKAQALRQCGPEVVERTVWDNDPWDVRTAVPAIVAPTLALAADPELGGLVSPALAEWLVAANPAVEVTWIDGAGHSIHRDSYPAFWEALGAG
jgi:pimeloyl-ACP methyl ester carboxylesterase